MDSAGALAVAALVIAALVIAALVAATIDCLIWKMSSPTLVSDMSRISEKRIQVRIM
jgi:hypothetical protein